MSNVIRKPSKLLYKDLLNENTPFNVQEAYRALRTNVMFSLPGTGCKCVGITSPAPGDGKSTTSANLAVALAQIGKRVILIDCDMRLPTVAARFQIPAAPGLSDFLVGQARIEDAVHNVEKYNISVLPAGNIPPDPTGLLEAKQLDSLFAALRKIYDFVIVDLPPVKTVSDAMILSRYVDGFLLAIREKQTYHRDVAETLKQLQISDVKLLGFVTTGGEVKKGSYSYYYKK
jgi:capsular exopolysaccharide synthesis family protein